MQIDMTVDTSSIENQEKDLEVIVSKEIVDQKSYDLAATTIKSIKALLKEIDETFNDMIQKAHELHKTALGKKAKHADPLKYMEKTLKGKMSRWIQAQEKARMEEENRIRMAKEKEAEELRMLGIEDAPIEIPTVKEVEKSGITYQSKWDFEIVNKDLIPRDYLIPDEKKIGQIVRAMKQQTSIPGIKVIESKTVVVR